MPLVLKPVTLRPLLYNIIFQLTDNDFYLTLMCKNIVFMKTKEMCDFEFQICYRHYNDIIL